MFGSHEDLHTRELAVALRRGICTNSRGHRDVVFDGIVEKRMHLYGIETRCTGRLVFSYYDTEILAIDFTEKRVTDFGYGDYSPSTRKNISGYTSAVWYLLRRALPYAAGHRFSQWTQEFNKRLHPSREPDASVVAHRENFKAFREGVPWCQKINSCWWFKWDRYDEFLAEQLSNSADFLRRDQNWRYWMYHWIDGEWTARFINEKAERRWTARKKRRERRERIETDGLQRTLPGVHRGPNQYWR